MTSRIVHQLDDDTQAAVLYSPFREKTVNPTSWNRKMNFWETVLTETALEKGEVTLNVCAIPKQFDRKGITPKCLMTVIEEMERNGKIKSLQEFNKSGSWMSWGFNTLVKEPLSWGVGRFLGLGSSMKISEVYVWPHVVQKMCTSVLGQIQSRIGLGLCDCIMSLPDAHAMCLSFVPEKQDFNIVLAQLEREKKIVMREMDDGRVVIKCCHKTETFVTPIKEAEIQVYRIKVTKKQLEKEIVDLSSNIDWVTQEAKKHVHRGKKTMALHCLRKKKSFMKSMDRKSSSVTMLEDIIQKIEDATSNELVVQACKAGVTALKTLNTELNRDKAEAVMDDVQEVLEEQEDISQIISSSSSFQSDDNSDELELELQNLLSVVEEEENKIKETSVSSNELLDQFSLMTVNDMDLPNVPQFSPSSTSTYEKTSSEPASMLSLPS